jgi:protease II
MKQTITYRGIKIFVFETPATRFGNFYYCKNNYGEPYMEIISYNNKERAIEKEKQIIDELLNNPIEESELNAQMILYSERLENENEIKLTEKEAYEFSEKSAKALTESLLTFQNKKMAKAGFFSPLATDMEKEFSSMFYDLLMNPSNLINIINYQEVE